MSQAEFMRKVVGQGRLKELFQRLIEGGKLPHALLFYGPEGSGKEAAALELGRFLLCQGENPPCGECPSCHRLQRFEHPDFFHLFPIQSPKGDYERGGWEAAMSEEQISAYRAEVEKKAGNYYYAMNMPRAQNILIGQVRDLIHKASFTAFSGDNRFALISPAQQMNKEAQNSLLKLLEEPPSGFYICLATDRPEALLPTTLSRCQPFYFPPLPAEVIAEGLREVAGAGEAESRAAAVRAGGSFSRALDILKNGEPLRQIAINEILWNMISKSPLKILDTTRKFQRATEYGDKTIARQLFIQMERWLRDIEMMDHGLPPRWNGDLLQRLQDFRKTISYSNIAKIRELIMESVALIDKNVYIDMIYLNLANRIGKMMKRVA